MYYCTLCDITLNEDNTRKNSRSRSGLQSRCKKCQAQGYKEKIILDVRRSLAATRIDLEIMKQERADNHKCRKCIWGTSVETKYICMRNPCVKGMVK